MDWIEQIFHVSPDGGNGSLEVGIIAGALVAAAMVVASAVGLVRLVGRWLQAARKPRDAASQPAERGNG